MGGIFKDMLKSGESLFRDSVALDYDYMPKLIPYRENEQQYVARCVKPLFSKRNGRNLFIYGPPGVGKTVACRHIIAELEETTDEVMPVYINCWQKNTTYKIMLELCDIIGYKFTQNKKTDELFKVVLQQLNKQPVVFVFDEIDKADDLDFLYFILESVYYKAVVLITNFKSFLEEIDTRIKSRLTAELLEFKPYNEVETAGVLKERLRFAFAEGVFDDEAFRLVAKKAFEMQDIRSGLYLMREAGNAAEDKSSKRITAEHVKIAITKLDDFNIKKSTDLEDDTKLILDIVKQNSGKKMGELYAEYQNAGGKGSYKSFQRKIAKLAEGHFVNIDKVFGGAEGNTSIVTYEKTKKLDEY